MSFLPSNLSTAIIFEKNGEEINTLSILFKVAYTFAQKGLISYILTKRNSDVLLNIEQHMLQASILERIHFKYFSSTEEIIQWCHQAHHLQIKPPALLVSLKDFTKAHDFESLSLAAALLDVMIYFSKVLKTKELYLLALIIIDSNSVIPDLNNFFTFTWLATEQHDSLKLIPLYCKGNKNILEIILNKDSAFENIKNIFSG